MRPRDRRPFSVAYEICREPSTERRGSPASLDARTDSHQHDPALTDAMARPEIRSPLDRLYRLPLSEFVTARNALAKESGADAAEIRSLQKPSLPAWAVNQLYWQRRDIYDDLIARAQDLRATHDATLGGKRADLRGASRCPRGRGRRRAQGHARTPRRGRAACDRGHKAGRRDDASRPARRRAAGPPHAATAAPRVRDARRFAAGRDGRPAPHLRKSPTDRPLPGPARHRPRRVGRIANARPPRGRR